MLAPVLILKNIIVIMLKVVFSALGLPWLQPGLQEPRNFLGRCPRPVTIGDEGLMWQPRGPGYPITPCPTLAPGEPRCQAYPTGWAAQAPAGPGCVTQRDGGFLIPAENGQACGGLGHVQARGAPG